MPEPGTTSRRNFLRTTGIAGATAAVFGATDGAAPAGTASDGVRWAPDPTSPTFTLAVMPDTQFLYFGGSLYPDVQLASFRYVVESSDNIVFLAHLGDLTQDGLASEFAAVDRAFTYLDRHRVAYSVVAGNHDVDPATDDQRGTSPYLRTMGPHRFANSPSFRGATPDGYNSWHVFHAAGRDWLVLAMDWRPSAAGFAWANDVLRRHPGLPAILTSHETGAATYFSRLDPPDYGNPDDNAVLTSYGTRLWDELINDNDQIFLAFSGHNWPPGRTVLRNAAGHDVHIHVTDYQNRYYGGAAMLRLYHFDLGRDVIDVETLAPWALAQQGNTLARQISRLSTPVDRFSMPFDFAARFAGFDPVPVRAARTAPDVLVPGTVAYWRFDAGEPNGTAYRAGTTIRDLSGHGNDLTTLVAVPGSGADALRWSDDHHPDQPGHGSLFFAGGKNPLRGAYLTTSANAPLNTATLAAGYTFEAFFKIPADFDRRNNAWESILSRWGESGQAGKSRGNTDPREPIAQLSLSNDRQLKWCVYPLNSVDETINWGHELPLDQWWHVAVVNDGRHTTMYVDGWPVIDNPGDLATGITSLGLPWVLGGYEYGGVINQVYYGWIGDVRIVERPLSVAQFMLRNGR